MLKARILNANRSLEDGRVHLRSPPLQPPNSDVTKEGPKGSCPSWAVFLYFRFWAYNGFSIMCFLLYMYTRFQLEVVE